MNILKIPREAAVPRKVLVKMNLTPDCSMTTSDDRQSDGLLASLAFRRRSDCSATLLSYCAAIKNYFRNEVANLRKIPNGPKGNKTSKTAASVEMLHGIENPHGVRLRKKLWKCRKRWLKQDNPLGGVLFYQSKFLVSCT